MWLPGTFQGDDERERREERRSFGCPVRFFGDTFETKRFSTEEWALKGHDNLQQQNPQTRTTFARFYSICFRRKKWKLRTTWTRSQSGWQLTLSFLSPWTIKTAIHTSWSRNPCFPFIVVLAQLAKRLNPTHVYPCFLTFFYTFPWLTSYTHQQQ